MSNKLPMLRILPSDTRFARSAFEGDPDCVCSRCHELIAEDETALRCWTETRPRVEIRYCELCQSKMGILSIDVDVPLSDSTLLH